MNDVIERARYGNYQVTIVQDDDGDAGNPRDGDELGIMLCKHPNYYLGDESVAQGRSLSGRLSRGEEYDYLMRRFDELIERGFTSPVWERYLRIYFGTTVILPLYLLDHSGLAMRTGTFAEDSGGWDTSLVGFIIDTAGTRETTGAPIEDIERQLRSEVKQYDAFLHGSVVGYVVEKVETCDHGDEHLEQIDACWGYLIVEDSDMEYVRSEALYNVPEELRPVS